MTDGVLLTECLRRDRKEEEMNDIGENKYMYVCV